jgi:hypothetical protein
MKTEYEFGSRTIEQRLKGGTGHNRTWVCDNPKCNKYCHYTPYCPNTISNILVTWIRRFFH